MVSVRKFKIAGVVALVIVLATLTVQGMVGVVDASTVAGDKAALLALYNGTGGANWNTSTNWNTDKALGEWHGVTTDATTGRVTELNLHRNHLKGGIPTELGNLSELTKLYLGNNGLTGSIPAELGSLGNLEYLDLTSNGLSGSIPTELGDLTNLETMRLSYNGLTGSIPTELGDMTGLKYLYIQHTKVSGSIPTELGGLSNLVHVALGNNGLSGSIPTELGSLSNLTGLYLYDNDLSGAIPTELGGLTGLTSLHLGGNDQLTAGAIPSWVSSLTALTFLNLSDSGRSGAIPSGLSALTELQYLYLHDNDLNGAIPSGLSALTELKYLYLNDNDLTGTIPTSFTSMEDMYKLRFDGNTVSNSELCAPWDADFRAWLRGKIKIGPNCDVPTNSGFVYSVRMIRVIGNRSSADAVKAAYKIRTGDAGYIVSVSSGATSVDILAAADPFSRHSINSGSRYIDADDAVHNFASGKSTYWRIRPVSGVASGAATYTVKMVKISGDTSTAAGVKAATKKVARDDYAVMLGADASDADVLAAANYLSRHSITTNSRYIDAAGEVHNFVAGKSTYWLIAKLE